MTLRKNKLNHLIWSAYNYQTEIVNTSQYDYCYLERASWTIYYQWDPRMADKGIEDERQIYDEAKKYLINFNP